MRDFRNTLALAVCLFAASGAAMAQDVTISSKDKAVTITGTLVSFHDETYLLDTEIGQLRLSRLATDCLGAACPQTIVTLDLDAPSVISRTCHTRASPAKRQVWTGISLLSMQRRVHRR